MIRIAGILLVLTSTLVLAGDAAAQSVIKLIGRKSSEVELVYGKRSVIFDLDELLVGTNGSLPGNPPHQFQTLFTSERDGMIYVVANVRSESPITSPTAACGGDRPQSLLWIEADKSLKKRRVQSEIYASCTYNYRGSTVKRDSAGITVKMGDDKRVELRYDNGHPEKGLVITKSFN